MIAVLHSFLYTFQICYAQYCINRITLFKICQIFISSSFQFVLSILFHFIFSIQYLIFLFRFIFIHVCLYVYVCVFLCVYHVHQSAQRSQQSVTDLPELDSQTVMSHLMQVQGITRERAKLLASEQISSVPQFHFLSFTLSTSSKMEQENSHYVIIEKQACILK